MANPSYALLREGEAMAAALTRDLSALGHCRITLIRHPRLPPVRYPRVECRSPGPNESFRAFCHRLIREHDAFWPIAPESYPWLEDVSHWTLRVRRLLLSSRPQALRITASKTQTAALLRQHGIGCPPEDMPKDMPKGTHAVIHPKDSPKDNPKDNYDGWTVKADHGVGCHNMYYYRDYKDALASAGTGDIVQAWKRGKHASLNVLCADGQARLLSCNRQNLNIAPSGKVSLHSILLGAYHPYWQLCESAVRRIVAIFPELWGIIGVDGIISDHRFWPIDINPRLTTSYQALAYACGFNPARTVLALARGGTLATVPKPQGRRAEIRVL